MREGGAMYSKEDLLFLSFFNTKSKRFLSSFATEIFRVSYAQGLSFLSFHTKELKNFILENPSIKKEHFSKIESLLEEYRSYSAKKNALKAIEKMQKEKIGMIFYGDEKYPKILYSLKDSPYVLSIKGDLPSKERQNLSFALVGKRNPSQKGEEFAKAAGQYLKEKDYYNISGLARGIDTIGHLETLGNTGAILGQGLLSKIYPKENKYLADKILDRGGFLLSELPPYEDVSRFSLLKRNRLQVALTSGIIIAETDLQGGTVQTFRYAKAQGKEIYVASLNEEFIRKYGKGNHVLENIQDLEEKRKIRWIQQDLF